MISSIRLSLPCVSAVEFHNSSVVKGPDLPQAILTLFLGTVTTESLKRYPYCYFNSFPGKETIADSGYSIML